MNVTIPIINNKKISQSLKHKLLFINNALDNGWEIKKGDGKYYFSKKIDKSSDVTADNFIQQFIEKNCNNKIN